MYYELIRFIIFIIIGFIIAYLLKKFIKMKKTIILLIFTILFTTVICIPIYNIPIENYFINFKSPEDAFYYYKQGNIIDMVYGEDSCCIYSSKSKSAQEFTLFPKQNNYYKIPDVSTTEILYDYILCNNEFYFTIYHTINTNDYYLYILMFSEESSANVIDNNNSEFKSFFSKPKNYDSGFLTICGYIKNFSNDYSFIVNNKEVFINQYANNQN